MRITVRHESGIRSILKKWGAAKLCGEKCFSLGTYNSAPLHYFPQRFCQIRLNLPGEELLDQPFWCKHHRARVRRVSGDRQPRKSSPMLTHLNITVQDKWIDPNNIQILLSFALSNFFSNLFCLFIEKLYFAWICFVEKFLVGRRSKCRTLFYF